MSQKTKYMYLSDNYLMATTILSFQQRLPFVGLGDGKLYKLREEPPEERSGKAAIKFLFSEE